MPAGKRKADSGLDESAILDGGAKRQKKDPFDIYVKKIDEKIFKGGGPKYVSRTDPKAGSSFIQARLGPNTHNRDGAKAISTLPTHIRAAQTKYPECNFKSGHMLNQYLGGSGTDPANLTILSNTGNSNMVARDARLKEACRMLGKLYEALWRANVFLPDADLVYIDYDVRISANFWDPDETPDKYITTGVIMNPQLTALPDLTSYMLTDEQKKTIAEFYGKVQALVGQARGTCTNPP